MAQYLALTYTADVDWYAPEHAAELAEYRAFAQENEGSVLASAVLHPTSTATVVRVKGARGGDVVTTDGPYAETKEALTGYYLIEAEDLDAAVAIAAAGLAGPRRAAAAAGLADRDRPAQGHRHAAA